MPRLLALLGCLVLPRLATAQALHHAPGATWAPLGAGVSSGGASAIALSSENVLYLGGYFSRAGDAQSNIVAAWDGGAWTSLGPAVPSGQVRALALAPDGRLYAGGGFFRMSGEVRRGLAVWDGTAWGSVGWGVNHVVGTQYW